MTIDPRTPVVVGVAQVQQRLDDPDVALEPIELMRRALEDAADDAGNRDLLARAGSVRVPKGFWPYRDPGRMLADGFGAAGAETVLTAMTGNLQQEIVSDGARRIAAGDLDVVLVTGAEAKHRSSRATASGRGARYRSQPDGVEPDVRLGVDGELWNEVEAASGLGMPVGFYAILENALRFADGQSLDEHRLEVARLWARFSEVAADNPHAWDRTPHTAEEIGTPGAGNRMLAFPYTKLLNSQWNVDQAAGIILCSAETARQVGVPEDRWVFPQAATDSSHVTTVSERAELHRCPAVAVAGRRALDLAGIGVDDLSHLEVYSCFPVAVRVQARELGIALDRRLTETGGMTFAGGPLNNFVLQATAQMVEVLRADPGTYGLVTAVGGLLTKQGFGVYSTRPPASGFRFEAVADEVARATPTVEVTAGEGPGRVVGYTVFHDAGRPVRTVAVCDLDGGARTVAASTDPDLAASACVEELCGRRVQVGAGGTLAVP